jgi:hypothetical protein
LVRQVPNHFGLPNGIRVIDSVLSSALIQWTLPLMVMPLGSPVRVE